MAKYRRAVDMERWKVDSRIAARGFNHAYDSYVEDGNGEDFFLELLDTALGPETDLLDVGCGHGDLTLELAGRVRSVQGVDRSIECIELARELAAERGITNAHFEQAELSGADEDRDGGPLPFPDQGIDLVVDRRGPAIERFIDDLGRVGRPGTIVLGMHPAGGPPRPEWVAELPTFRDRFAAIPPETVAGWVLGPARRRSIDTYRLWWLDVPEHLPSPRALYDKLTFDGAPPYDQAAAELERVFKRHAGRDGLVLRHQRLVFRLQMP